jgi:WD40 repeat protein
MSVLQSSFPNNFIGIIDSESKFSTTDLSKKPYRSSPSVDLGIATITAFTALSSTSFVIGDNEGGIYRFDKSETTWSLTDRLGNHRTPVTALQTLQTGYLVSGAKDGTVYLWDTDRATCLSMIDDEYHEESVLAFHQTSDGRLLVLTPHTVTTWDVAENSLQERMGYSFLATATCFTVLTDDRIAVGTRDGSIQILEEDRFEWTPLEAHSYPVKAVYALSREDIVSVGEDGTILVWDCKTNEIVDMLEEEAEESVLLANDRLAYWQDGQLLDWNFG